MYDVNLKKDPRAPPLLPVTTISAMDKTKKPPPPLPRFLGLHMAGWWALYIACAFAVFAAYATSLLITPCADRCPTWWWRWCVCRELDGESAARARAVLPRFLWCAALQAAAAVPALLIPGRRRSRWALAFVAYAATASNHLRFATLIGLVVVVVVDLVGVLWVVAGGLYLFCSPMFAMLSLGGLLTEYLEEFHLVMLHGVRYY